MASPPHMPDAGWSFGDVPKDAKEALSRNSFSNAVEITKSAIVRYLLDHFHGPFAYLFRRVVASADQFELSSINARDPMAVPVQLLRRYSDFRKRLPCILINNTGAKQLPTSISGGHEGGFISEANNNQPVIKLTALWRVPIEIIVATTDPTQSAELMESVSLAFTTLRTITRTSRIAAQTPGHNWVVRLPATPPDIDGPADEPLNDDPKDRLWTYTLSLSDVQFESTVYLTYPRKNTGVQVLDLTITTDLPDEIPLGTTFPARPLHVPKGAVVRSDNPAVALVDSRGNVTAKRIGIFTFLVLDARTPSEEPKVLFSKTVKVV